MPGLVPGIHAFLCQCSKGVDGRDKPGHDQEDVARIKCSAWSRIQKARNQKARDRFPGAGLLLAMLNICR